MPPIIGITGTIGAGKGTAVEYLVQTRGFTHYSVRQFLNDELMRRGLPQDRDALRTLANELRHEHGADYILSQVYARALRAGTPAVLESVRTVGEVGYLKAQGMIILAIDADLQTRYERIVLRGTATDTIDFATFVHQEELEMTSTDPSSQNIAGVMALADYHLFNNGTPEELFAQLDSIFPL
jgi:dephospho-CoA kinase